VHMTYVLRCAKMWICAILHVNESVCAMFKLYVSKYLTSSNLVSSISLFHHTDQIKSKL
jgi:hypothetical protein